MAELLKKWFAAPIFALDEEKSSRAWTINTVQLTFLAALLLAALVLIPLHIPRKVESYSIILTLVLLNGISRTILFRGHLKTASTLMISVAWVLFVGAAAFSGGIHSPFLFAVVATAIASSLLINLRIGMMFVALSALGGLGIALLQQNGLLLEEVFVYSPIADWFLFSLGLVFVHILVILVLNNLRRVLARERQNNAARQQAEQALRQSEERFQMFMCHFPGLAYMKSSDGQILFANQGFNTYLGLNPEEMIGKTSQEVFGTEFGEKINRDDERVLEQGINEDIEEELAGRKWITHKFPINQPGARPLLGGVTIDTTERVLAEEALRASERRFRSMTDASPLAIYMTQEPDPTAEYINPTFTKLFGYSIEDLPSAAEWWPRAYPDEEYRRQVTEEWQRRIDTALTTQTEIEPMEVVVTCKDGSKKHISWGYISTGVQNWAFGLDLTERIQAEEKLRASENRFKQMFEQAPIAINITRGTEITYANPAYLKIFGYSSLDEIKQLMPLDLFTPETRLFILENIQQRAQGLPVPNDYEAECFRKDGSRFPIHMYLTRTEFLDGPATVAFLLDITERKQTEKALQASEARFRALIEQAPVAISLSRNGLSLYTNPKLMEYLKISNPEEGAGHPIADYFAPQYKDESRERTRRRALGLPVPMEFETVFLRSDGSEFPALVTVAQALLADGPANLAFITDITERRRAEEKVCAALEEKEILLREVHHRVKNNLQVIIALIKMQSGSTQDAETQQFLKELEGQAHTMALVYEQLYQSETLSQVDMGPYLRQLTFNVLDTFGQKNSIRLELDAPIRLSVAQAMPCGLIVNELFTNILKHAFPAGFQNEPSVKIALHQDGNICQLMVSDNGAGLPRGYDWRAGQNLGLRLVNLWATHQLGGTLDVLTEAGTMFKIAFSLDD